MLGEKIRDIFNPQGLLASVRNAYAGPPKTDEEKKETAYHEAGHAYVSHKLNTNLKVGTVGTQSPIIHSLLLGLSFSGSVPTAGHCNISGRMETREHGVNSLVALMAGSAGEKILHGPDHQPYGLESDREECSGTVAASAKSAAGRGSG